MSGCWSPTADLCLVFHSSQPDDRSILHPSSPYSSLTPPFFSRSTKPRSAMECRASRNRTQFHGSILPSLPQNRSKLWPRDSDQEKRRRLCGTPHKPSELEAPVLHRPKPQLHAAIKMKRAGSAGAPRTVWSGSTFPIHSGTSRPCRTVESLDCQLVG